MRSYFACIFLPLFFSGFILSCGKKAKPHLAEYGPLSATDPNMPSVLIAHCIPGETITCEGDFKYNTGAKSEISKGGYCEANGFLSIQFELVECKDLMANSWSGAVTCKTSQSQLVEIKPLSLDNIICS